MNIDFGRMGNLTGVFVTDTNEMEKLIDSKSEIYFGEVLGKHSDVFCPITKQNITLVTTDDEFIDLFEKHELSNGYNPFDYIFE